MKKITLLLSSVFILFVVSGAQAQGPEFGFSLGASYPEAPEKVGFDSAVKFKYNANRLLAIGVESGFGWVSSKSDEGFIEVEGLPNVKEISEVNFYSVPVLGTLTLNFPFGEDAPMSFFISGGAGYSWTFYRGAANHTFAGFTWQALAGLAYSYDDEFSSMKIFGEIGYRGTRLKSDISGVTAELPMSAPFIRVGVSFPLGGSDYY